MISIPLYLTRYNPFFKYSALKLFSSVAESKAVENVSREEHIGHTPVMPAEVLAALRPENNQIFIDMTFGAGGHSRLLLNAASIKLYCLDRDPVAYENAIALSKKYGDRVTPLLGRFSDMQRVLKKAGVEPNSIDGILIDAGCSSMQMETAERGFSIIRNGPLDMRMDGNRYSKQPTAADVLNNLDIPSLTRIFKIYGEEKHAKKIAHGLFNAKCMLKSINTTQELAELIKNIMGGEQRFDKLHRTAHVGTKVFQALRIFVNDELNELNYGMEMAHSYLKPGGKIAALTFHSMEDRIIKRHFLGINMDEPISNSLRQKFKNAAVCHTAMEMESILEPKWKPLYKHVIGATVEEVESNPRSRSARLRAAEKFVNNS